MKIVVLAAGNSSERDVSIVSGTGIGKALRALGHKAVLADVYFGIRKTDVSAVFEGDYDAEEEAAYIRSRTPFLEEEMKRRRHFFGPQIL